MAIRTPDQRLRVFVSSTLQELAPERRAVREAIESLRLTPVMFEQGARPHPPRALYRAYLEQSDVFVGLYWERYGWVAPGEEVSGLEDEYVLAAHLPKLIYLKRPAAGIEPRLEALIDRIRADDRASYRLFADAAELRSLVADDLAVLLTERFSVGTASVARVQVAVRPALPRPLTRLIGRDADIERVMALLADPDVRLITLLGPGGIGKTRLALAVAERLSGHYADGIAYVDLAPVSEPALVQSAIADAIGLREPTGRSLGIALRESLADAEILIVLDSMEQLLDAASELSDLLATGPRLRMLVTSRRVLNLRGEHTFAVEPLSVQASDGMGGVAIDTGGAAELFLDRARAVRPDYAPDGDELAAIREICARLDGLPLAIELASARVRTLSAQAIVERMGHRRLAFLRGGPRDLPPRQQALRDTIAWSHSLLETDAQALYARLGVFVGSAGLDAIERVANPDGNLDTLDLLAELVDGSLVRAMGEGGEPRFGMLETIREYAVEQLDAGGEADSVRARHEAHYVALAEEGERGLGSSRQIEWLDRLTRENDNFRAVLRRAIRRGDASAAVRLARLMAIFWQIRSVYTEGRRWADAIRAMPTATEYERGIAWIIGALLGFWQGDIEVLDADIDSVVRVTGEADDRRAQGLALLAKAIRESMRSADGTAGREAVAQAAAALDAEADLLIQGIAQLARAYVARLGGRIDEALELVRVAYDVSSRLGEWYIRAVASTMLASGAIISGDAEATRRHALEALIGARQLRNLSAAGYALELWAAAELADGRPERAARLHALGMRAYRESSSRPWPTEMEFHRSVTQQLEAAFGDRLEEYALEAGRADFDVAITELAMSQPATA